MGKKYFYEFSGNVYLEANDQAEAEKLVTGIPLEDFLINEDVYEIDEDYIALDLKKRQEEMRTHFHPLDDSEQYEAFKKRECRYNPIFNDFLNGKFDKNELMKRINEAEKENLDDHTIVNEINMIDLEDKKLKTVKHCIVD